MNIELRDPACVPDTFCEGIGNISKVGNNLRIEIFANRDIGDGEIEHLVVARLVWPRELVANVISQLEKAMKGMPFMDAAMATDDAASKAEKLN
jgi:hypothetical protein